MTINAEYLYQQIPQNAENVLKTLINSVDYSYNLHSVVDSA